MFEIVDRPLVWIAVEWPGLKPGPTPDDLAVETTNRVELFVELVDRDGLNKYFLDPEGKVEEPEIIARVVKNWRGVVAQGKPVPYSAENAALLCKAPGFALAFTSAYLSAASGKMETREKNSQGSPNNGRADDSSGAETTTRSNGNASASA